MSKVFPCLWFKDDAEAAATFYVSLLPGSRIDHIQKNLVDGHSGKAGSVLVVSFTLAGQKFIALNGGVAMEHSHAISFSIDCEDQAEVDRLWEALTKDGAAVQCGWLRDRYGMSWQIIPSALPRLLADPDPAKAARVMQAMMQMVKIDIAGLEAAAAAG